MLRDAQDHELNALPRELQIAYLYVADLNKRQAFFSRFFSRYDYEAIEAMSMRKVEESFDHRNSTLVPAPESAKYGTQGGKDWKSERGLRQGKRDEGYDEVPVGGRGFAKHQKERAEQSSSWDSKNKHHRSRSAGATGFSFRSKDGSEIMEYNSSSSHVYLKSAPNRGDTRDRGRSPRGPSPRRSGSADGCRGR